MGLWVEEEGGGGGGGGGSSSLAPGVKMGVDAPQRRLEVFGDSLQNPMRTVSWENRVW